MAVKTFTQGEVATAADTNTFLANGGLVYITEASATSGTILGINSCFTSTYDDYLLVVSGARSAASGLNVKLRASGTPNSGNYVYGGYFFVYGSTTLQFTSSTGAASWDTGAVTDATNPGAFSMTIYGPNIARATGFEARGVDPRTAGAGGRYVTGFHNVATAYDGIEIISTQTYTAITARVYGYRKA